MLCFTIFDVWNGFKYEISKCFFSKSYFQKPFFDREDIRTQMRNRNGRVAIMATNEAWYKTYNSKINDKFKYRLFGSISRIHVQKFNTHVSYDKHSWARAPWIILEHKGARTRRDAPNSRFMSYFLFKYIISNYILIIQLIKNLWK